ncbi:MULTISPECIES: tRNA (guanosine(46)-N(7))-methyltransferase TrmB [unclassified Xanthobacter]|uniref:tRNA (guanine(46)-N(7))-methyltransferase TrmB n=1 Tax=unclassified Xanthobacter TaxID=2623496 RepID=UPI00145E0B8F|nr:MULTISPECIES: tRNA (guanosine(46)-N(7))-methyltransferase TrmB [unclassified Xanthobacter]NMN59306.1 tRNA (guanine-N7-)-methyltransferase [Xanthobacter sp. SG618]UJX48155.1 tRNA (guanosine(46)-N7)-methyltransferase TrmB [Xanthobacter sp. YC-JY1]
MSQQPSEHQSQSASLPSAATEFEARGAFYGRRIGKTLRGLQQDALTHLLPRYKLDLDAASVPANLFPEPRAGYWLEIGCGCGEHLIDHAARRPDMGFIGAEPFLNGLARMLVDLDARSLANVRVFDLDAALLLDRLPTASFEGVDLFYPDPWPKKRHWKRRFVRPDNLDRLARVIRPGGVFRFASDVPHYVGWTLAHVRAHGAFTWTAQRADDWRKPYPFWPGTRYEAKAIAQGRVPTYLTFVRR